MKFQCNFGANFALEALYDSAMLRYWSGLWGGLATVRA